MMTMDTVDSVLQECTLSRYVWGKYEVSEGHMKLLVVEGSPEELARLDALTGFFRDVSQRLSDASDQGTDKANERAEGGIPRHVQEFIARWASNPMKRELVEEFVARVLELGNTEVELGKSNKSPDGLNKYLMLRHVGIRRKGAAVYVTPHWVERDPACLQKRPSAGRTPKLCNGRRRTKSPSPLRRLLQWTKQLSSQETPWRLLRRSRTLSLESAGVLPSSAVEYQARSHG